MVILKRLSFKNFSKGGRNNKGLITSKHKGGGLKKRFRFINFSFSFLNLPGIVLHIFKDPNRSSFIALILYKNGFFSYILAPFGLTKGSFVLNSISSKRRFVGLSSILSNLSLGTVIHNIELKPGKGSSICRAAGAFGIIIGHNIFNKNLVLVRLKSKEEYLLHGSCFCSLGLVSNFESIFFVIGKAGTNRNLGKRPKVRGVAMNPVDHPHGGGEGKTSGGPFSLTNKGKITRKKNKISNKFIVRSRRFFFEEKKEDLC